MKIPIKLKKDELLDLTDLLEKIIHDEEVSTRIEAIISTCVVMFYITLKKRCIAIDKPAVSFSIDPVIAMGFVEFFEGRPVNPATLSGNAVIRLIGLFDRQTRYY